MRREAKHPEPKDSAAKRSPHWLWKLFGCAILLLGVSFAGLLYESQYHSAGWRFRPCLHNSLLIAFDLSLVLTAVLVVGYLLWWASRKSEGKHWGVRALVDSLWLMATIGTPLAVLALALISAFLVVDGTVLTVGDKKYLRQPLFPNDYACLVFVDSVWMRDLGINGCDAVISPEAEPAEATTSAEPIPSPAVPSPLLPESAQSAETDRYCEQNPDQCFISAWNGQYVAREWAQETVQRRRSEVEPIAGSKYGWLLVDAATGSRLIYLTQMGEDGWDFVSEMPPARELGEFTFVNGQVRVQTGAGEYVYLPDQGVWRTPKSE